LTAKEMEVEFRWNVDGKDETVNLKLPVKEIYGAFPALKPRIEARAGADKEGQR